MGRNVEHRRFLARTAWFFSVPTLCVATVECALWRVGESRPATSIVDAQRRAAGVLYQRARFPQQFTCYKLSGVRARRPSIVVFGSSRVMKFRSELFGDEAATAYNFGGLGSLAHLERSLAAWPATPPTRVLLGVDPWWLNARYAAEQRPAVDELQDAAWSWQAHLSAIRGVVRSDRGKLVDWLRRPDPLRLGVGAQGRNTGFRADGSLQGDLPAPTSEDDWKFVDREVPTIAERVRSQTKQFVAASGVDDALAAELRARLQRWKADGVQVVGFFPPVAEEVLSAIAAQPGQAAYQREVREVVERAFAERGFPFFDFTSTRSFGADDTCLIDGFHSEETGAARMMIAMLRDPRTAALFPTATVAVERAFTAPRTNRWYLDLPTE